MHAYTHMACDLFDTFATHAGFVSDKIDADWWAQNGGSLHCVFTTFKQEYLANGMKNQLHTHGCEKKKVFKEGLKELTDCMTNKNRDLVPGKEKMLTTGLNVEGWYSALSGVPFNHFCVCVCVDRPQEYHHHFSVSALNGVLKRASHRRRSLRDDKVSEKERREETSRSESANSEAPTTRLMTHGASLGSRSFQSFLFLVFFHSFFLFLFILSFFLAFFFY